MLWVVASVLKGLYGSVVFLEYSRSLPGCSRWFLWLQIVSLIAYISSSTPIFNKPHEV